MGHSMQRRNPVLPGVNICIVGQQQYRNCLVRAEQSEPQRRVTERVLSIHVRLVGQQQLDRLVSSK